MVDSGKAPGSGHQLVEPGGHAGAVARGRRWRGVAPAAVFALALSVRLVFVRGFHSPADHVFSDMWVYDHRARNLLSGALSAWDSFTPAGYPAFLALVYGLGGSALTIGVLQALLGALTALLTSRLAARVFSSPAQGVCVGVVTALHVPAVLYTGLLLTETLFSFLVMAATWALTRSLERRWRLGFVLTGLLLGLGVTVRPNLLVFVLCVPIIVWFASGRRWRNAAFPLLALAGALVLPLGAAMVHNARLVGHPTLGTNGGLNFYLNFAHVRGVTFRDSRGEHRITPIPNLLWYPNDERVDVPFYVDGRYYQRGLELVHQHPERLLIGARNLVEFSGAGRQGYWPEDAEERFTRAHRHVFLVVVILPSVVGLLLLALRRRYARPEHLPLVIGAAFVTSSLVPALFFLGDPRMRIPFDPLHILLAAAAYVWLGRKVLALARRRMRGAMPR